jgi:hypothetical protein
MNCRYLDPFLGRPHTTSMEEQSKVVNLSQVRKDCLHLIVIDYGRVQELDVFGVILPLEHSMLVVHVSDDRS